MRLECPKCLDFTSHFKDAEDDHWVCAVCDSNRKAPPETIDKQTNKE